MLKVFTAAPDRTTRVFPEKLQSTRVNAPPPYASVVSLKVHPLQLKPSSICDPPSKCESSTKFLTGGTSGTPPVERSWPAWANTGCSRVDVWLPETMKNMEQAPTINKRPQCDCNFGHSASFGRFSGELFIAGISLRQPTEQVTRFKPPSRLIRLGN